MVTAFGVRWTIAGLGLAVALTAALLHRADRRAPASAPPAEELQPAY